ncbi:ABC transporter substrate-binding protein [Glaesserella parasuis]|uniref:ABC transporter substrate-binding protein n=1 Tax=Glaesserella parasuis TaxID=738 RepID=UPI0024364A60|nr:ABC transporter substrate-binding protein [Glaesserella parasuis]MDG6328407.1 ABC transporter substrate-binding protein [Glaesserella parasuis]
MNNERRDFLKLLSLFTLAGSSPFLQAQEQQRKINHNAPLKIGYLPITDATPLLVAHAQGLFEKYNVEVKKPIMFRSWAQLIEAFLSGNVNLIHVLSPMSLWTKYGSKAPVKVVMWNHLAGSALTVPP